jgi:hypothetical protein
VGKSRRPTNTLGRGRGRMKPQERSGHVGRNAEREQLTQLRREADRKYDQLIEDPRTESAFVMLPPTVDNIEAVLRDLRIWIGTRIVREWEGDDAENMPPGVVVTVSLRYLDAAEAIAMLEQARAVDAAWLSVAAAKRPSSS